MKILFLAQRIPEPPNKGDKIRSCHFMRRIGQRHEVHVACLVDEESEFAYQADVEKWAASVTCHLRRSGESAMRGAACALTGSPISVGWFRSASLAADVDRLIATREFDVAVAYCSSMAGYLEKFRGPRVIDFVDVDSEKWKQYANHSGFPKSAVYALEHKLLRSYERRLLDEYDRAVIISQAESELLARLGAAAPIDVVSNGVDLESLRRPEPRVAGRELVFVGALDYFANAEGIRWFVNDVLPAVREKVPGVTVRIVGRQPGPEVEALGAAAGVTVVGEVDDVRPELWRASVAVVPLRIAQGLQNKVLEAMAAGLPVVSSPAAVRALGANSGAWRTAETAAEWAEHVAALVDDPAGADRQAELALDLVRDEYSWDRKARDYEAVLAAAAAARPQLAGASA